MKEEFVTYDTALALKELGFNEPCFMYIDDEGDYIIDQTAEWLGAVKAPLKQQVFRWFREKYKPEELNFYIHLLDTHTIPKEYLPCYTIRRGVNIIEIKTSDTYEEAESACIDKLIEILKKEIV
jgi:hypothetical protein